jgi:hypothetical protein
MRRRSSIIFFPGFLLIFLGSLMAPGHGATSQLGDPTRRTTRSGIQGRAMVPQIVSMGAGNLTCIALVPSRATMRIYTKAGRFVSHVVTDAEGNFQATLMPGTYSIIPDFQVQRGPVTLGSNSRSLPQSNSTMRLRHGYAFGLRDQSLGATSVSCIRQ